MRYQYYITINIKAWMEGFPKDRNIKRLNIKDLIILTYLQDFWTSPTMKYRHYNKEIYKWISRSKICRELPILKFRTLSPISKSLVKLEKAGLIVRKTFAIRVSNKEYKNKLYYKLTEKADKFIWKETPKK